MDSARTWLLAVIAAGVLVIAGVLLWTQVIDGPREHTLEWRAAYEEAEHGAKYYCTLGGVVPGLPGLHDPAYKACVEAETKGRMEVWESENPGDVWE